jgi:hypothetical protein
LVFARKFAEKVLSQGLRFILPCREFWREFEESSAGVPFVGILSYHPGDLFPFSPCLLFSL